VRVELRDHAFGDAEVFFYERSRVTIEGNKVSSNGTDPFAEGYLGKHSEIYVTDLEYDVEGKWVGAVASDLMALGQAFIERNDETGPDDFVAGRCMPGLTLEGVKEELIAAGVFVRPPGYVDPAANITVEQWDEAQKY
jgi:hypothetical protein